MLDEETQVEAVRYPKGSDVMGLTATLITQSTPGWRRISAWLMAVSYTHLTLPTMMSV